ncbi:MAG: hypothetical protein WAM14_16365 [Candidatus Nitrosopolaris sp.]
MHNASFLLKSQPFWNEINDDKQRQTNQAGSILYHGLMASFRDKTELLTKCSRGIKLLLLEGDDVKGAN